MALKFDIDPKYPMSVVDDIVPQLEMLADFISFSGDHLQLSDLALSGMAGTLAAISRSLRELRETTAPQRDRPDLRAV